MIYVLIKGNPHAVPVENVPSHIIVNVTRDSRVSVRCPRRNLQICIA